MSNIGGVEVLIIENISYKNGKTQNQIKHKILQIMHSILSLSN